MAAAALQSTILFSLLVQGLGLGLVRVRVKTCTRSMFPLIFLALNLFDFYTDLTGTFSVQLHLQSMLG